MGLFDTIHVKFPLACPSCGAEEFSVQTHELGDLMAEYRIGSVVTQTSVLTGIVKETLWCSACSKAERPADSPVYLVIWHSVLAGVEQDLAKAEARLAAVDRLDLIGWLDDAQCEARRWKRLYHHFRSDIERWREHLARAASSEPENEDEAGKRLRAFSRILDLPEEILSAPDPLAAILEKAKNDEENSEGGRAGGWW